MPFTLPDINRVSTGLTVDQIDQYYQLPTTALEYATKQRQKNELMFKISDTVKWNQISLNNVMVVDERPADTYQQAFGTPFCDTPTVNVQTAAQRTVPMSLFRKRFESPEIMWVNDFQMWMKNRVARQLQTLIDEEERFRQIFYRTYIFHNSPMLAVLGRNPIIDEGAPYGLGNEAGTGGKSNGYLASMAANMGGKIGYFTLQSLGALLHQANDMNLVPMKEVKPTDNTCINDEWGLMIEGSEYAHLAYDPYVRSQTNASIADFNLVNGSFKGKLLGCVNVMPSRKGQRIFVNTNGTIEFPQPEELRLSGDYKGRPDTTSKFRRAQVGVGYLVGDKGYSLVDPGPLPAGWKASDGKNGGLVWEGRPLLTDNFLISTTNADNSVSVTANTYGERMKWISEAKMGIVGANPFNIMPFLYLRRGVNPNVPW